MADARWPLPTTAAEDATEALTADDTVTHPPPRTQPRPRRRGRRARSMTPRELSDRADEAVEPPMDDGTAPTTQRRGSRRNVADAPPAESPSRSRRAGAARLRRPRADDDGRAAQRAGDRDPQPQARRCGRGHRRAHRQGRDPRRHRRQVRRRRQQPRAVRPQRRESSRS